jgi:hypothetical protein
MYGRQSNVLQCNNKQNMKTFLFWSFQNRILDLLLTPRQLSQFDYCYTKPGLQICLVRVTTTKPLTVNKNVYVKSTHHIGPEYWCGAIIPHRQSAE